MELSNLLNFFRGMKPEELMLLAIIFVLLIEKKCDRYFIGILVYIFLSDFNKGLLFLKK
ncbi:MAG: hypothetical protein ACOZCL_09735 [Bacillota bacterium]